MSDTRVYVALTASEVEALGAGPLAGGDLRAFAVTPALREALPVAERESDAQEELEHRAMQDAASAGRAPVCVAAVDVPAGSVQPRPGAAEASAVTLDGVLGIGQVASFHVGDAGVEPDPDQEIELSWYDVTERGEVAALLGR